MTPHPELTAALDRCRQAAAAQPALAEAAAAVHAQCLALYEQLEALRRERDEFAGFALAGQATVGLAHELNNVLNGITLQASVVQLQADEKFHGALDVIRRQAAQATGLLRPLGQLSAERAKTFYPVDLGATVKEVLREQPALAGRVAFRPSAAPLPPIPAVAGALKQLVRLLLHGATAGAAATARAWVERHEAVVRLVVEIDGPDGPRDADALLWGNLGDVERLAAQSLLRQFEGALRVEAGPQGCYTLRVSWAAPRPPD